MPKKSDYDLMILIFGGLCVLTAMFFSAYLKFTNFEYEPIPEPTPEPSITLINGCNSNNESRFDDPLIVASGGKFSCCKNAQICDKQWWINYAHKIPKADLDPIKILLKSQGVITDGDDFNNDEAVREKVYTTISTKSCPEVCNAFEKDVYTKTFTTADLDRFGAEGLNEYEWMLKDETTNNTKFVIGRCIEECAKNDTCKHILFVNYPTQPLDNNNSDYVHQPLEDGFCYGVTDSVAEKLKTKLDLYGDENSHINPGNSGDATLTLISK
jgi:hypothetical protein